MCETPVRRIPVANTNDIEKAMGEYIDWGKLLLAPAPVDIGILGQLIFMSDQFQDFPIKSEDPNNFELIRQQISAAAEKLPNNIAAYQ